MNEKTKVRMEEAETGKELERNRELKTQAETEQTDGGRT